MQATVVIRTFNSAQTIRQCLNSITNQTIDTQIVLVDSGSTDGTCSIAASQVDEVLRIPHAEYTPGRALNLGFSAAEGDVVMPLSSHCAYQDDRHVARALAHHVQAKVAATVGASGDELGAPLQRPLTVDAWPIGNRPWWGFSNHSSSVTRSVWAQYPFDESLTACEDKEWASRIHAANYGIVYDPNLIVPAKHRRNRGVRQAYRRGLNEGLALGTILSPAVPGTSSVLIERFVRQQYPSRYPRALLWVYPPRVAESLGLAQGFRLGGRDASSARHRRASPHRDAL
jgi:rhamnosyltransferase